MVTRVIIRVTILITPIKVLIALLAKSHDPPSSGGTVIIGTGIRKKGRGGEGRGGEGGSLYYQKTRDYKGMVFISIQTSIPAGLGS